MCYLIVVNVFSENHLNLPNLRIIHSNYFYRFSASRTHAFLINTRKGRWNWREPVEGFVKNARRCCSSMAHSQTTFEASAGTTSTRASAVLKDANTMELGSISLETLSFPTRKGTQTPPKMGASTCLLQRCWLAWLVKEIQE